MMHTGCTRGGDTMPVLIVGLWRSEVVGVGVWRRPPEVPAVAAVGAAATSS